MRTIEFPLTATPKQEQGQIQIPRQLTNGRSSADALTTEPEICETNLIVFLKGGACCPK